MLLSGWVMWPRWCSARQEASGACSLAFCWLCRLLLASPRLQSTGGETPSPQLSWAAPGLAGPAGRAVLAGSQLPAAPPCSNPAPGEQLRAHKAAAGSGVRGCCGWSGPWVSWCWWHCRGSAQLQTLSAGSGTHLRVNSQGWLLLAPGVPFSARPFASWQGSCARVLACGAAAGSDLSLAGLQLGAGGGAAPGRGWAGQESALRTQPCSGAASVLLGPLRRLPTASRRQQWPIGR